MRRIIFVLCVALIIIFNCSGCADLKNTPPTYKDLYQKVKVFYQDNEDDYAVYQDIKYYFDKMHFFDVTESPHYIDEGDILLGWNGLSSGWGYIDYYYSDTSENPLFIYNLRLSEVLFRNDYDYQADIFVLNDTNEKFIFSDAIKDFSFIKDATILYKNSVDIELCSEKYPRLKASLTLFQHNNEWYVSTKHFNAFSISDEFVDILTQNGYIPL